MRSATNWIHRHPTAAFLGFFFSVGWAPAFLTYRVETAFPPQLFILATTLLGFLAAVTVTWAADGTAGARELVRRTLTVRAHAGWYAFALLSTAMVALPAIFLLVRSEPFTPEAVVSAVANGLLVQTAIGLFTNNLWEEVTWMGFVQRRLQSRHGAMRAVLLTAPLFLLQHLALQSGSAGEIAIFLVAGTAVMIPFRALLAWVYNRTGSLFLVGLLHAASNATAVGAGFGPGLFPRLYPGQGTESLHVLATAVLGIAVLAFTRGRLGTQERDARHGRDGHTATSTPMRVLDYTDREEEAAKSSIPQT